MRRRPLLFLILALVACLASCGGGQPTPSASSTTPGSEATGLEPPGCVEATLAYDPLGEVMLLINCVDQFDQSSVEQIWSWEGTAWQLVDADGPDARVVTGIAFDAERQTVVRYGGLPLDSNECTPETWEWSQGSWAEVEADPPAACDHAFLIHDTTRDVNVLFGGGAADGNLVAETWGWDGTTWELLADDGPSGRAHFGFLYDESHQQALLYGGYDGTSVFADFWSWDGTAWTEIDFAGPGARSHFGWAIGADGLLLFGGASSASTFTSLQDDTWLLTDGRWAQLEGAGPSTRGSPALGYDAGRGVYVLHGGFDADGGLLADTWEWDGDWRCVAGCEWPISVRAQTPPLECQTEM